MANPIPNTKFNIFLNKVNGKYKVEKNVETEGVETISLSNHDKDIRSMIDEILFDEIIFSTENDTILKFFTPTILDDINDFKIKPENITENDIKGIIIDKNIVKIMYSPKDKVEPLYKFVLPTEEIASQFNMILIWRILVKIRLKVSNIFGE